MTDDINAVPVAPKGFSSLMRDVQALEDEARRERDPKKKQELWEQAEAKRAELDAMNPLTVVDKPL